MALVPPGMISERFRVLLNRLLGDRADLKAENTFEAPQAFPVEGVTIGGLRILAGEGSPAGEVEAPVGSLFLRSDGGANTSLYVKESGTGSSGWVAK